MNANDTKDTNSAAVAESEQQAATGTETAPAPAIPFPEAEKKPEKNNGFVVITLPKPFEYCGKKYKEFTFDFDSLQGADMEAVEAEMMAMGDVYTLETSSSYLTKLAARAAGVGSDMITALPLKYYEKIKIAARNFLSDMG